MPTTLYAGLAAGRYNGQQYLWVADTGNFVIRQILLDSNQCAEPRAALPCGRVVG